MTSDMRLFDSVSASSSIWLGLWQFLPSKMGTHIMRIISYRLFFKLMHLAQGLSNTPLCSSWRWVIIAVDSSSKVISSAPCTNLNYGLPCPFRWSARPIGKSSSFQPFNLVARINLLKNSKTSSFSIPLKIGKLTSNLRPKLVDILIFLRISHNWKSWFSITTQREETSKRPESISAN